MARPTPLRIAKVENLDTDLGSVHERNPAFSEPPARPTSNEFMRGRRLRAWRGLSWPINEVLLAALVRSGKSRDDIARLYAVAPERVDALRDTYGV
jgi:hypothetical protein